MVDENPHDRSLPRQAETSMKPLLVLAVGVAFMNGNLGVYVVPFQIGAWMDGLQLSAAQSGLLGTLEIAAMSLTAIVVAPIMPRWSHIKAAMTGALIAIAAQAATSGVDPYFLLALARLAVGIGCGLIFAAVVAAIATSPEPDRLMGFGQAVMNLSFMFVFVLIPYTLLWQAQRGLFLGLAALMLVSMPLYRLLPDGASISGHADAPAPPRNISVRVLIHFVAIVILNLGLGALWGFLERLGVQIGLSAETIGTVLSLSTIGMIAGSLFAGWLGIRLGRAVPMLVASLLCGISALAVMTADSLAMYASAIMLYGVAYLFVGPYIIVGMASALDTSGRLAPACGGVMFFSYSLGIAGGGYIADTFSYSTIGWLALAGCTFSGILFFANARTLDLRQAATG